MTPKDRTKIAVKLAEIDKDLNQLVKMQEKLEIRINTLYKRTTIIVFLLVTYIGSSSEVGGDMIRHVLLRFLGGI